VLVTATQARQALDQLLRVPHFQMFRIQAHVYLHADQPARHHVAVSLHVNQAALVHATLQTSARFQASRRQRTQHRHFLRQPLTATGVELVLERVQKTRVLLTIGKIPAAAQHQGLVQRFLETPVPLLDVAVLVGVAGLDLLPDQSVMLQQTLITLPELLALRSVIHRQTHAISPVPCRQSAQFPQGVLQTFAQALEALRKADRRRLPVRVGQHEVIDHVLKRLFPNRHAQVVHVREVRGRQPARLMHLAEEHLFGRPRRGPPLLQFALQRPQLPIAEPTRIASLQVAEDGLGLQARLLFEQGANLRPDFGERIDTGPPVVRSGQLTGQLLQSPILTCRLVVHVTPRRRHAQALTSRDQPP
jgi:hypothetical protein